MGDLLDEILAEMREERRNSPKRVYGEKARQQWQESNKRRHTELKNAKIALATAVGEYIRSPNPVSFEKMKKEWTIYHNRYLVGKKR